jgi:release factor glutamine methyltransferase
MKISDIQRIYKGKIDQFDLELLICHAIGKSREFVLAYPDYAITKPRETKIKKMVARRAKGEPVAYILGHKEFYRLDFIVNKHTLIPRPETEQIVDGVLDELKVHKVSKVHKVVIADVGTGSGNIITSIVKTIENFEFRISNFEFIGIDISKDALKIAKKNARVHGVDKKIKFLHGSLLIQIIKELNSKKLAPDKLIVTANLPYLSKEIYNSAQIDVKKFEPKSALYSPEAGLQHYRKLLGQIKKLQIKDCGLRITGFLEISPEQKQPITKLIKSIFPKASISFQKDLAGKWRVCKITL